jgi:hypothetical protein
MSFDFTALHTCNKCGAGLESSDAACTNCVDSEEITMVFRHLSTHELKTVDIVVGTTREHVIEEFARSLNNEDPLEWSILGVKEYLNRPLGELDASSEMHLSIIGLVAEYAGPEDLRQLASYHDS